MSKQLNRTPRRPSMGELIQWISISCPPSRITRIIIIFIYGLVHCNFIFGDKLYLLPSACMYVYCICEFISEQFTLKAHPALFGGRGERGRGWAIKKGHYYSSLQLTYTFETFAQSKKNLWRLELCSFIYVFIYVYICMYIYKHVFMHINAF